MEADDSGRNAFTFRDDCSVVIVLVFDDQKWQTGDGNLS